MLTALNFKSKNIQVIPFVFILSYFLEVLYKKDMLGLESIQCTNYEIMKVSLKCKLQKHFI